jgi:hypothetical protein
MSEELESADTTPGVGDNPTRSRPWTPEAAMEPVPPLAPPPARPGAGMPVVTIPRPSDPAAPLFFLMRAVGVALVIAGLVVLVLVFGR